MIIHALASQIMIDRSYPGEKWCKTPARREASTSRNCSHCSRSWLVVAEVGRRKKKVDWPLMFHQMSFEAVYFRPSASAQSRDENVGAIFLLITAHLMMSQILAAWLLGRLIKTRGLRMQPDRPRFFFTHSHTHTHTQSHI